MKRIILSCLVVGFLLLNNVLGQSYNIDLRNFQQINETEFTFDAYISNADGVPFTLFSYQFQFEFDIEILNGMSLDDAELSYDGLSTLEGVNRPDFLSTVSVPSIFTNTAANRIYFGSGQFSPTSVSDEVEATYLDDTNEEYLIDRFRIKLKDSDGELHNFGDAAPNWRFRDGLAGIIATRATEVEPNNTTITGTGFEVLTRNRPGTIFDHELGDRQLAGYWFDGAEDTDYFNADNWNNVTDANANTLPGDANNAIIGAVCIVAGGTTDELNELTVAMSGFLTIGDNGAVTTDKLFIDEPDNSKGNDLFRSSALLARWGFDNALGNPQNIPVPADEGSLNNISGVFAAEFHANVGYRGRGSNPTAAEISNPSDGNYFYAQVNTIDYKDINLSFEMYAEDDSKQNLNVIVEASIDENVWTPVGYSFDILLDSWIPHQISISDDYSNQQEVFVRWKIASLSGDVRRFSIRNIVFTGSLDIPKLLIKSTANGTGYLIHNNAGVEATVERYLSQFLYHFVSSPVIGATNAIFQYEGTYPPEEPEYADFFRWVEADMTWYNLNLAPATDELIIGSGYAVAYSDEDKTKVFEGEINVGTIEFEATYTPGDAAPYWNERGFNLIGNPYPAPLNAMAFVVANPDVYGLYFWDEAAGYTGKEDDYATWTTAGGTKGGANKHEPDGYIAPGQGFMAKIISEPVSVENDVILSFDNNMRIVTPTYFYKEAEDRDRIWLSVTGPQEDYNEILVAFMEGAEIGLDRSDAQKLKGNPNLAFYSIMEDVDFVIQGLPVLLQTDTYEIPLGIDAGITGQYTFNVEKMENFDPNTDITFEDRLTGEIIDLRTAPQYTVHIDVPGDDPVVINDRFFLHFNGPTSVPVIGNQKLTRVYALNNQIIISHTGNGNILDVDVINTMGQVIVSAPVNATEATISVPGRNLVYIVRVRTGEGVESHKLLIR